MKNGTQPILIKENGPGSLEVCLENFLLARSYQNYTQIYYLNKNRIEKKLLRITLKAVENIIPNSPVLRCHRTAIVNLIHIITVRVNQKQVSVKLYRINEEIPVSRRKRSQFFSMLEEIKPGV